MELRFFNYSEFDSPDVPGSGEMMDSHFLELLDKARSIAGIPFVISEGGGYRTEEYNRELCKRNKKASRTSSHMRGLAADIICRGSRQRCYIVASLLDVGINRIGISKSFIHCDIDLEKEEDVIWIY